jgi:hypothetical protein
LREVLRKPPDPDGILVQRIRNSFDGAGKTLKYRLIELAENFTGRIATEWKETRDSLVKIGAVLEACRDGRLDSLSQDIEQSSIYRSLNAAPTWAYLESPRPVLTGTEYSGEPAYFINGIWRGMEDASKSAESLARYLKRPVSLIYNPSAWRPPEFTTGTPYVVSDIAEAAYDRVWPLQVIARNPSDVTEILAEQKPIQLNKTTRMITHLLYHSEKPISIVSHSQGCILVRNACFALFLMGMKDKVKEILAWVNTANPLNDNEMWPLPTKYTSLIHPGDPLPRLLGFEGWDNLDPRVLRFEHGFQANYVDKITPDMLWPA